MSEIVKLKPIEQKKSNRSLLEECKTEVWEGRLFWFQSKECIFPQLTQPTKDLVSCAVKGKFFVKDAGANTWCKYLKITFWHKMNVVRLLVHYEKTKKNKESKYHARLEIQDHECKELLLKCFYGSDFWAIVTDHMVHKNIMILLYNEKLQSFEAIIPTDETLFTKVVRTHLYDYFIVNYEFLHQKSLTNELLNEADERGNKHRKGKTMKDIYEELSAVKHSTDIIKNSIWLSFFCASHDFKEKVSLPDDIVDIY